MSGFAAETEPLVQVSGSRHRRLGVEQDTPASHAAGLHDARVDERLADPASARLGRYAEHPDGRRIGVLDLGVGSGARHVRDRANQAAVGFGHEDDARHGPGGHIPQPRLVVVVRVGQRPVGLDDEVADGCVLVRPGGPDDEVGRSWHVADVDPSVAIHAGLAMRQKARVRQR